LRVDSSDSILLTNSRVFVHIYFQCFPEAILQSLGKMVESLFHSFSMRARRHSSSSSKLASSSHVSSQRPCHFTRTKTPFSSSSNPSSSL
ncbi:hypothetical protein PFISCL1PPCAC_2048, partial [Pristionchus fissidentatus]